MSYLLVQILMCLLIAGLIGLIIGWLLSRLGYKKKLVENDESWENQIGLMSSKYDGSVSDLNGKLAQSENKLKAVEADLKAKLNSSNSGWESKVQGLMSQQSNSAKELEALKLSLSKSENIGKAIEVDLKAKLEQANSKVQGLMSQKDADNKELESLKSVVNKLQDGAKKVEDKLRLELESLKVKLLKADADTKKVEAELKLKLDDFNSSCDNKVQDLISEKDNSLEEIKALKLSLKKAEDEKASLEADLKSKLDISNRKVQGLMNNSSELNKSKSELNFLKVRLKDANNKFFIASNEWGKKLQNLEKVHKKQIEELKSKVNVSTSDGSDLEALTLSLSKAESRIKTLENELKSKLDESTKEIASLKSTLDSTNNNSKTVEERLKSELSKSQNETKTVERDLLSKLDECKSSWERKVKELESSQKVEPKIETTTETVVSKVDRKSKHNVKGMRRQRKTKKNLLHTEEIQISKNSTVSQAKDNLQEVKGIGRVLEGVLNELGIYRFEQIASWTKEEVLKIDEAIAFPGRIEREEWVKQAKQLALGETTEFAKRVQKGEVPTSKKG